MRMTSATPTKRGLLGIGSLTVYLTMLLLALTATGIYAAEGERALAARVNGEPIYLDQLDSLVESQIRGGRGVTGQRSGEKQLDHLRRRALDQIIDVELLHQAGRQLDVPDLENKIAFYVRQYRERGERGRAALSEEQMRSAAERQVYVDAYYLHRKLGEPEVPEERIRELYEQGKHSFAGGPSAEVRHVLVEVPPEADAEELKTARGRAEVARRRLLAGEDFAQVARELSDCASAAHDGELGRIEPGYMPQAFDQLAFSLPPGEISPIVQTPFGFHVLEVQDRHEGGVPSYEQMRDFLHRFLQKQLREERLAQEIAALRAQARIEILLPESPGEARPSILERGER